MTGDRTKGKENANDPPMAGRSRCRKKDDEIRTYPELRLVESPQLRTFQCERPGAPGNTNGPQGRRADLPRPKRSVLEYRVAPSRRAARRMGCHQARRRNRGVVRSRVRGKEVCEPLCAMKGTEVGKRSDRSGRRAARPDGRCAVLQPLERGAIIAFSARPGFDCSVHLPGPLA